MTEWDVRVRVTTEVDYLKPAESMAEKILRRQVQFKIDAMARKLEEQVQQTLVEQINAEIDLARAASSAPGAQ